MRRGKTTRSENGGWNVEIDGDTYEDVPSRLGKQADGRTEIIGFTHPISRRGPVILTGPRQRFLGDLLKRPSRDWPTTCQGGNRACLLSAYTAIADTFDTDTFLVDNQQTNGKSRNGPLRVLGDELFVIRSTQTANGYVDFVSRYDKTTFKGFYWSDGTTGFADISFDKDGNLYIVEWEAAPGDTTVGSRPDKWMKSAASEQFDKAAMGAAAPIYSPHTWGWQLRDMRSRLTKVDRIKMEAVWNSEWLEFETHGVLHSSPSIAFRGEFVYVSTIKRIGDGGPGTADFLFQTVFKIEDGEMVEQQQVPWEAPDYILPEGWGFEFVTSGGLHVWPWQKHPGQTRAIQEIPYPGKLWWLLGNLHPPPYANDRQMTNAYPSDSSNASNAQRTWPDAKALPSGSVAKLDQGPILQASTWSDSKSMWNVRLLGRIDLPDKNVWLPQVYFGHEMLALNYDGGVRWRKSGDKGNTREFYYPLCASPTGDKILVSVLKVVFASGAFTDATIELDELDQPQFANSKAVSWTLPIEHRLFLRTVRVSDGNTIREIEVADTVTGQWGVPGGGSIESIGVDARPFGTPSLLTDFGFLAYPLDGLGMAPSFNPQDLQFYISPGEALTRGVTHKNEESWFCLSFAWINLDIKMTLPPLHHPHRPCSSADGKLIFFAPWDEARLKIDVWDPAHPDDYTSTADNKWLHDYVGGDYNENTHWVVARNWDTLAIEWKHPIEIGAPYTTAAGGRNRSFGNLVCTKTELYCHYRYHDGGFQGKTRVLNPETGEEIREVDHDGVGIGAVPTPWNDSVDAVCEQPAREHVVAGESFIATIDQKFVSFLHHKDPEEVPPP